MQMKMFNRAAVAAAMGVGLLATPSAYAQDVHSGTSDPLLVKIVRENTAAFFDVRNVPAGYNPVLGCVSGQQEGAMGLHYLNGALLMDNGALDEKTPEALIYEKRGGRETLVGVEYIVMAADWDHNNPGGNPPALRGQNFQYVGTPNRFRLDPFYELHVWAWRDNPHGSFVDWNTSVTCDGYSKNPPGFPPQ
jgi:hypothetical protein